MALSRDQIKQANDSAPQEIDVPEWGDTILLAWPSVRRMAEIADMGDGLDAVTLLIACAVDESGAPLFTDDDREWLENKNGAVVGRVVTHLTQMFEDLEGNSGSAPDGATSLN